MSIYDTLNEPQRQAVFHTEGPLLLLAGAGSGKTRVLTHRIGYLIEEKKVAPWNIMAITFTNKAAKEMRERVDKLVGNGGSDVWVSTFHSSCVRILRRDADKVGYAKDFTIYDSEDSKKLIRECMKKLNVDPKYFKDSQILSMISGAKNQNMSVADYRKSAMGDLRKETAAKIFEMYQERMKTCNVMDFDDLLVKTVELFTYNEDVLLNYQNKFKYIMVDEYQDTNGVQFKLIYLLAKKHQNLCVVGDDDQSIYRFRGADISNILDFESVFKNAITIRLEQNYRSTKTILDAANEVIKHNKRRKAKRLWTDNSEGEMIVYKTLQSEVDEANFISHQIMDTMLEETRNYSDYAVLYRTNAQSRAIEDRFVRQSIPYRLVGGVSFYQRKEIKDILSYLILMNNSTDDLALKRIINVPKRGIGDTTVERLEIYAAENEMSIFETLAHVKEVPGITRGSAKIIEFHEMMQKFKHKAATGSLLELVEAILKDSGYQEELRLENTPESLDRLNNIGELVSKMAEYETNTEEPTLSGFLEEVSLVAAIDVLDNDNNKVVLMTIHSAKGLEFPVVFLAGMEDGLFPSYMSIQSGDPEDIDEERRLCYVGITRAKERLFILNARMRNMHGQSQYNGPSRFIQEIPSDLLDISANNGVVGMGGAGNMGGPSAMASTYGTSNAYGAPSAYGQTGKRTTTGNRSAMANTYGSGASSVSHMSNLTGGSRSHMSNVQGRQGSGHQGNTGAGKQDLLNMGLGITKGVGPNFKGGTYGSESAKPPVLPALNFKAGDLVKHGKFGVGQVQKIESGGADYQVTINFPSHGVKKLMASFAGLKKI